MLKYYNRKTKDYSDENIAGNSALNLIYGNPLGRKFLPELASIKILSQIYGSICDSGLSKFAIPNFVRNFNINMEDYEKSVSEYKTFNDFFYRKLSSNSRPINTDECAFVSPCDSKLLAIDKISEDGSFYIKGFKYTLKDLVQNDEISDSYKNGTCLIFRLCPTDYHRFHFIDSGYCTPSTFIKGKYYSVNPIALETIERLFCENKREYSILKTKNFDDILYVEVGATFVGSIIQTYTPDTLIQRGTEKGYFKFGGSTVILFTKANTIKLDEDILTQSKLGIETQVYMGEKIGIRI